MASAYGAYHSRPPFGRAGTGMAMQKPAPGSRPAPRPIEAAGSFRVGRVLRRMLGVLGPNAVTLLALLALAAIPERTLYHLPGSDSKLMDTLSRLALALSGLLLQLAIMRLSFDAFAGKRANFGACVGQAFRSFFPVLAISILMVLPVSLALLLAVAPGVMLSLAWSVAVPVRIAEGDGIIACLKRSAELTRGHRWKILAVFLLVGFALAPLLLALQVLWGIPISAHSLFFARNWLARLVFYTALGLALSAVYFELRMTEAGTQPA